MHQASYWSALRQSVLLLQWMAFAIPSISHNPVRGICAAPAHHNNTACDDTVVQRSSVFRHMTPREGIPTTPLIRVGGQGLTLTRLRRLPKTAHSASISAAKCLPWIPTDPTSPNRPSPIAPTLNPSTTWREVPSPGSNTLDTPGDRSAVIFSSATQNLLLQLVFRSFTSFRL